MDHPLDSIDYLFQGGTVVTMNPNRDVIENGAVAVRGSEIVWVGDADQLTLPNRPMQTIDATGKLIIPGLINAHSHLAMTIFRGLIDDQPLEAWLSRIWPLETAYATAENVRVGVQLALAEMIRGGTTCAADMYWQFHETTRAAKEANFRLINGPAFTEIVGPDGVQPENRLSRAREYLDLYLNDPLIRCCVQVHSTYTASRSMLEQARRLSEEYQLPFVTHASESKMEVQTITERYGMTPIEYIDSLGLLGPRTLLAHCVHLRDDEVTLLKERGASVAHCPESNLKLGNGVARASYMLANGVNVALGTDGAATNNDLDMFGEMRTAALIHKGVTFDPTVMDAQEVFAMATIAGARALGMGERIGSLEPAKLADIALISQDSAHMTPHYNVYSQLVYSADASDVSSVMINGKMVMENRQLTTLDEAEIKDRVLNLASIIRNSSSSPSATLSD